MAFVLGFLMSEWCAILACKVLVMGFLSAVAPSFCLTFMATHKLPSKYTRSDTAAVGVSPARISCQADLKVGQHGPKCGLHQREGDTQDGSRQDKGPSRVKLASVVSVEDWQSLNLQSHAKVISQEPLIPTTILNLLAKHAELERCK